MDMHDPDKKSPTDTEPHCRTTARHTGKGFPPTSGVWNPQEPAVPARRQPLSVLAAGHEAQTAPRARPHTQSRVRAEQREAKAARAVGGGGLGAGGRSGSPIESA